MPILPKTLSKTDLEDGGPQEISVAGLSGALADAQTPLAHGADKHTDVARKIFFLAAAGYGDLGEATKGYYGTLQLPDAAHSNAYFAGIVPDDFVSITHVHYVVIGSGTGNLICWLRGACAASGEAFDGDDYQSTQKTFALTSGLLTELPDCAAECFPNIAAGDYLGFSIYRDGTDANDTVGATVHVIGVLIEYTGEQ